MERKIGEIFEHEGEWYQCVNTGFSCADCDIKGDCSDVHIGACSGSLRTDGKAVRFKKLEKVGEPHWIGKRLMQPYELFTKAVTPLGLGCFSIWHQDLTIEIEIKQNKEDMSNTETLWYGPDKKETKSLKSSNLKPFSLEAAKSGKPVCTRDGRKARILCYDFKQNEEYPILVAVENKDGKECALLYSNDGISEMYKSSNNELAILPEKKEGWVNVIKNQDNYYYCKGVFDTEEYARNNEANYPGLAVATVKIEWEE